MKKVVLVLFVCAILVAPAFACAPGQTCFKMKGLQGEWRGVVRSLNNELEDNVKKLVLKIRPNWEISGTFGNMRIFNGKLDKLKGRGRQMFQEEFIINAELEGELIPGSYDRCLLVIVFSQKKGKFLGRVMSKGIKTGNQGYLLDAEWRIMGLDKLDLP